MSWVDKEKWWSDGLKSTYERAVALINATPEDVSKPYELKYQARSLLESLLAPITTTTDTLFESALRAHILVQMGLVDREVEELSVAERRFEEVLHIIRDARDAKNDNDETKENSDGECNEQKCNSPMSKTPSLLIVPHVEALNQLGLLWSERGDFEKAKQMLDHALEAYNNFPCFNNDELSDTKEPKDHDIFYADLPSLIDSLDNCNDEAINNDGEKSLNKLELLNTLTHFYLAQVLQALNEVDRAAQSCHTTLQKQLKLGTYDKIEWATNAATLAHYFSENDYFDEAKRHLAAAMAILKEDISSETEESNGDNEDKEYEEEKEEAKMLCVARVERGFGNLCCSILNFNLVDSSTSNHDKKDGNIASNSFDSSFDALPLHEGVMSLPLSKIVDFEAARQVFLIGQRSLRKSQEILTLNDHCVDHTEIAQTLSQLHKLLAKFETDWSRRYKIHRRRLDLLEPILDALSPTYYLIVRRQLQLELAEVHETMLEAKLESIKNTKDIEQASKEVTKINWAVESALYYYQTYLNSFKSTDENEEISFPKDDWRSCMLAHFHMARLHGKHVHQTAQRKIETLNNFKAIADFCDSNEECKPIMKDELPVCREMVQLLTIQIQKMKQ